MNFNTVKSIRIPEGIVKKITHNGVILWQHAVSCVYAKLQGISSSVGILKIDSLIAVPAKLLSASYSTYIFNALSYIGIRGKASGLSTSESTFNSVVKARIRGLINEASNSLHEFTGKIALYVRGLVNNQSTSTHSFSGIAKYITPSKSINNSTSTYRFNARELIGIRGIISNISSSINVFSAKVCELAKVIIEQSSISFNNLLTINGIIKPSSINNESETNVSFNSRLYIAEDGMLNTNSVSVSNDNANIWTLPVKLQSDLTITDAYSITQSGSNLSLM